MQSNIPRPEPFLQEAHKILRMLDDQIPCGHLSHILIFEFHQIEMIAKARFLQMVDMDNLFDPLNSLYLDAHSVYKT